jgi:hypothetical protein
MTKQEVIEGLQKDLKLYKDLLDKLFKRPSKAIWKANVEEPIQSRDLAVMVRTANMTNHDVIVSVDPEGNLQFGMFERIARPWNL